MSAADLPNPDVESLVHSQLVVAALQASIESEGPLSFGDFMQFVLYGPGFGYYMAGNEKIGAAGDFVTAPAISPLFGACLARQSSEVLAITGGGILEVGAGTGALAASVLSALDEAGCLPAQYCILEPSADFQQRQRAWLSGCLPARLYERVEWLTELPAQFVGVVIANEVIDAMPVEQFVTGYTGIQQVFVDLEKGALCTTLRPAAPAISDAVTRLQNSLAQPLPPGYRSEVNLLVAPWLQALSDSLACGLVMLVDYGYPQSEYYLPERTEGTLRCYFRHHMHDDYLLYPGLQDITADVDFTRVARAATQAGFDLHGYTSQAQFLVATGLAEHAARLPAASGTERYRIAQQVQTLSGANTMGERFQVMGLSRSLDADLQGFMRTDFSHRL